MKNENMTLCHNTLLAVAILTIGAVEIAALLTGHDGTYFNLTMGAMVALASGAPAIQGILNRPKGQ